MHIAILDAHPLNPGDLSWQPLEQLGTLSFYPRTAAADTYQRAKDADIVITNKVCFDSQLLARLPKLRCIVVTATGYNIIDLQAASEHGIVVCNAPAYSTGSVAQHVFALLLHIANRISDYAQLNRQGRWANNPDFCYIDYPTVELAGKTIGIVGLGSIGRQVAAIAKAMGMEVIAINSKQQADLPDLLSNSDIVTLHCPLTDATRHLINRDTLALMRRGAILINTARGPLVDEAAVAEALHSGHLAAFGADVLSTEPPAADNPLLTAPNAYTTPHIAWATLEARQRLMQITIDNVRAFISGKPINVVNV